MRDLLLIERSGYIDERIIPPTLHQDVRQALSYSLGCRIMCAEKAMQRLFATRLERMKLCWMTLPYRC